LTYPELLARGTDEPLPWTVDNELSTISINYTSGTTGRPKGVMYSHRGAYVNALGELIHSRFAPDTRYLWTLPMFHCNGWCTTWAITAMGGTHVCLRAVRADVIWRLLDEERVTHLNASPTVLVLIANAEQAHPLDREVVMTTAGAPPSPTVIAGIGDLGARIVHLYGLTETYGPYTVNETQPDWSELSADERARKQATQGVAMVQADPIRVVDEFMKDVPRDGETMGEIVMRGNNVMKGYYNDPEATAKAFRGGWFHSGDLGVQHSDGYIQLRDRQKDIIISGGENISTVEVEQAIDSHPGVLEVAVIGVPDAKWGERPKAYVVRKPGAAEVSEAEIIAHVQKQIAKFKAPGSVEFIDALPKTATGKVRKVEFRDKEWAGHEGRVQG
jgi:fatty-acyl-CoA synthase